MIVSLQGGRPDEAQQCLQQLTDAYPGEPLYCERLATLLESRGYADDAVACYDRLLAARPELNDSRYNLARLLKRLGYSERALREYQQCLARNIERPEDVLNNISVIHSAAHRHAEALASLQVALGHNPDYVPALYNLALLHEERGQWIEAKALFGRILEQQPRHAGALAHIANGETIVDPVAPIIRQMKRALRHESLADAEKEELLYALGKVHDDCRHFNRAFDYYRQANRLSQERSGAYRRVAQEHTIDELMRRYNRAFLRTLEPVSAEQLVFVCGMFRSGSTLLEQALGAHPALKAGGEIDFFQQRLAPFPNALLDLQADELHQLGTDYLNHLVTAFGEGARIINKRPDNFLCIGLLQALYPNARFIISTREPLDNCLSLYFQPLEASQQQANDLLDAGHYYLQYRRLMRHWHGLADNRLLEVNYEDLVTRPREVLAEALAFLQLDWDENCLQFHRSRERVRTASVHQVRQALHRRSSGRWHNYARQLELLRAYLQDQPNGD